MASLFLAAKVEEVPKRSRDVINVFHHIDQIKRGKKPEPIPLNKRYTDIKNDLIEIERFMLKEMGFSTYVEHPHKYLLQYLSILNQGTNQNLAQKAWNYMNDSLREPLCVRFRPEVIATSCIYMAARVLGIVLPEYPHPWWELFDAKQDQLDEIAWTINQLYKEPPAQYISLTTKKQPGSPRKRHSLSRSSSVSECEHSSGSDNSDKSDDEEEKSVEHSKSHSSRSKSPSPQRRLSATPSDVTEKVSPKQQISAPAKKEASNLSGSTLQRKTSEQALKGSKGVIPLDNTQPLQGVPQNPPLQPPLGQQPQIKRQKQYIQRAQPYHHHTKKH